MKLILFALSAFLLTVIDYIQSTTLHTHLHMFHHKMEELEAAVKADSHMKLETEKESELQNQNKRKKRPFNFNLPDQPIYWQGWVKYFHYENDTHYTKPPALFQNNAFYQQRVKKEKVLEKDFSGKKNVPTKASFYFVLYNKTIAFYSKRSPNIVNNLVDSMKIRDIEAIAEDDMFSGGVRDLGDFSFGCCLEIKTDINYTPYLKKPKIWIICFENIGTKTLVHKLLIKLKIRYQRSKNNNVVATKEFLAEKKQNPSLGGLISNPLGERKGQSVQSPKDGYWILLQDWTSCNKKCGGGLEFQQWMCVPPKHQGKPCFGTPIKTRPCNEQACPSVNNLLALTSKGTLSPKPIIKVGPFSNRPQRYSKCLVRENDAFIREHVEGIKEKIQKPIRLIMNNHTISIFRDETYEELGFTFDLSKTNFLISKRICCFNLKDNDKTLEVCSYDSECNKQTNSWVLSWQKDFKLFKYECHVGLTPELITKNDEITLEDKLKEANEMEAAGEADKQVLNLKRKELTKKARQYELKKKKTEDLGFKVISKEIELEDMVQKEEKEKEDRILRKIQKKIAIEKKKEECLEKSFEERELDEEFVETEKQSKVDDDEIKIDTAKKIEDGRWRLKKKLMLMKEKAKARARALNAQLSQVRAKMSKEIILANRNGNIRTCDKGKLDRTFRESYCNEAFIEDWVKNSECKSDDDWCYTCCENEFGLNYVTQRDSCYNMCDKKIKTKIIRMPTVNSAAIFKREVPQMIASNGHWTWAPKEKTNNFTS